MSRPPANSEVGVSRPPANSGDGVSRPPRILLVEDEWLVAADLEDALVEAGCEVVGPAPSAPEALALLAAHGPVDAAVLDVHLNPGTSLPVAEALRQEGTPFVFATGFTSADLPAAFRAQPLLSKPVDPAVLMARLRLR